MKKPGYLLESHWYMDAHKKFNDTQLVIVNICTISLTRIVTASLTTPAIVTVTALVAETRIYSVKTCNKIILHENF